MGEIIKQSDVQNVNIKEIKRIRIVDIKNGTIIIKPNAHKLTLKTLESQSPCGFRGFLFYFIYTVQERL